jgi:hypothetical protein
MTLLRTRVKSIDLIEQTGFSVYVGFVDKVFVKKYEYFPKKCDPEKNQSGYTFPSRFASTLVVYSFH